LSCSFIKALSRIRMAALSVRIASGTPIPGVKKFSGVIDSGSNSKPGISISTSGSVSDEKDTISYEKDELGLIGYNMYMTPEDAARGLILMNQVPRVNEDSGGSYDIPDLSKQPIFKK